jgi:hypothetical protein
LEDPDDQISEDNMRNSQSIEEENEEEEEQEQEDE